MKKLLSLLLAVLVIVGAGVGMSANAAAVAASYTVTYDGNGAGATNVPAPQTKTHDEILTLRNAEPTRPGYKFLGWATTATGPVDYKPGDDFTANATVTLFAVWKANEYTVRFAADAIGVQNMPASQTKVHNQVMILSTKVPTRKGYDFLGWSLARGGAKAYAPGDAYELNAGTTLHALWAKQPGAEPNSPLYYLWWLVRYILLFGWLWM